MHNEAYRLLQPTIRFARFCGVCPSALRDRHIPTANKWFSLFLSAVSTAAVAEIFNEHYSVTNDITAFIFSSFWVSMLLHQYTILTTALLTGDHLSQFFTIMESAQRTLSALNIHQPPHPSCKSQLYWLGFFIAPSALCLITSVIDRTDYWRLGFAGIMLVVYAKLSILQAMLQLVNGKLELLNWHLDDLNVRWPLFLPQPVDVSFSEFACVAAFRRSKFVRYGPENRTISPDKIESFNKAHFQLSYAYKTLNCVFSVELLTLTCVTALIVTCGCFRAVGSLDPLRLKVLWLLLVLHHATAFVIILAYATNIKHMSRRTAVLVHDLLDEEDHSPEIKEKLAEFSQALLHRPASLTAAGFFHMDLKLVSRLASVLAPITLFLIQNDNRPRASVRA